MTTTRLGEDVEGTSGTIHLGYEERKRHIECIGITGAGKTTFLTNTFLEDLNQGRGGAFIDPLGNAVHMILNRIPEKKLANVYWFDPNEETFPHINLLDCPDISNPQQVDSSTSLALHIFKRIWEIDRNTPRLANLLNMCFKTLIYNRKTLADLPRLLRDKTFRQQMIATIPKAHDFVRWFWEDEFSRWGEKQDERTESTLNKVLDFLTNTTVRRIIDAPKTELNLKRAMDNNHILLFRMSPKREDGKGGIGDEGIELLGKMVVALILDAATDPSRKPNFFSLVVDEFHKFASTDFADMLFIVRSYGVAITLGYQERRQLKDDALQGAVDQINNRMVFRVSQNDSKHYATRFAREAPPGEPQTKTVLAPVIRPIEYLLGVRGAQENPVIDRFTHERLTIFDDAIKESHHEIVQRMTRKGLKSSSVLIPVSELDLLRREMNRIFYEMMREKNPRKVIPIDIFFQFASSLGFTFPLLYQILLDPHAITAKLILPPYSVDEYTTEYLKFLHQFIQWKQTSVDATAQKLQEVFSLVWTSRSDEEVQETIRQIHQESYTLLPAWENAHFQPYNTLIEEKREIEKRYVGQQKSVSEAQAILSAIEGQSYEEWLRCDNQWKDRVKSGVKWIVKHRVDPKEFCPGVETRLLALGLMIACLSVLTLSIAAETWMVNGGAIHALGGWNPLTTLIFFAGLFFISSLTLYGIIWAVCIFVQAVRLFSGKTRKIYFDLPDNYTTVELSKRELAQVQEIAFGKYQESTKERLRVTEARVLPLEFELRAVQKTMQEEQDRLYSEKSRLVGTEEESALHQEVRELEAFVFELREFMQALADDPPPAVSKLKEVPGTQKSSQEMEAEMVQELMGLAPGTAWCHIVEGTRDGKYKLQIPQDLYKEVAYGVAATQRFAAIQQKTYAEYCKEEPRQYIPDMPQPQEQKAQEQQPKRGRGSVVCQKCKANNPPSAKFCNQCGAAL